jgi:hypothetical protein
MRYYCRCVMYVCGVVYFSIVHTDWFLIILVGVAILLGFQTLIYLIKGRKEGDKINFR